MKLYLVRMKSRKGDEWFYKIGVTHHSDVRLRFTTFGTETVHDSDLPKFEKLKRSILGEKYIFPYDLEVIHEVNFALELNAKRVEAEVLEVVRGQIVLPRQKFTGQTECFFADAAQIGLIIRHMSEEADFCRSVA